MKDLSGWPWSSYHSHISGIGDGIVSIEPMLDRVNNWKAYVSDVSEVEDNLIRQHGRTGRPAGDNSFISQLEVLTGRDLIKKRPGRKPRIK